MTERTLNFGENATDADFQIRDTSGTGGDFVIEHLPSGDTFTYDASENDWLFDGTEVLKTASINASGSPYTTQGEDVIFVDESSADVTVTLATGDLNNKTRPTAVLARSGGGNSVLIETEGAATIEPGDNSQVNISGSREPSQLWFWPNSSRSVWRSTLSLFVDTIVADSATITLDATETVPRFSDLDTLGASGSIWGSVFTSTIDGDGSPIDVADDLVPETDGTQALGSASNRFESLHANSGARIGLVNANQSIPDMTVTTVDFDTTQFEDSSVVTVDLSNNQITLDKAGTYMVSVGARWNGDSNWSDGDLIQHHVEVNGSIHTRAAGRKIGTSHQTPTPPTAILSASAGDVVTGTTFHDSGSTRELNAATDGTDTWLAVGRLG